MADNNISSIKFYQGNTKSVGVNYFDYEGAVESGVERTKTIINIFKGKGYNVKRIGLCGGVDELSHTGYVSYSAAYTDAETFVNNAYSDYVVAKEKAEKEYGVWLSSYNFTDFSILFSNDDTSVRVFIGAGKDITIRTEGGSNIGLDEFVPLVKKEIYQDDCIVEGATDLDTASLDASTIVENISKKQLCLEEFDVSTLTSFFNVKSLDELDLYCICVNANERPLVLDKNTILFYTDKEKAERAAANIARNYDENTIQAIKLKDVYTFFATVSAASSLFRFSVNGQGKVTKFIEICSQVAADKIVSKGMASQFQSAVQMEQPKRNPQLIAIHQKEQKEMLKALKKEKGSDYYLGLVSMLCGFATFFLLTWMSSSEGWAIGLYLLTLICGFTTGCISMKKSSDNNHTKRVNAKVGTIICGFQIAILILSIIGAIND